MPPYVFEISRGLLNLDAFNELGRKLANDQTFTEVLHCSQYGRLFILAHTTDIELTESVALGESIKGQGAAVVRREKSSFVV